MTKFSIGFILLALVATDKAVAEKVAADQGNGEKQASVGYVCQRTEAIGNVEQTLELDLSYDVGKNNFTAIFTVFQTYKDGLLITNSDVANLDGKTVSRIVMMTKYQASASECEVRGPYKYNCPPSSPNSGSFGDFSSNISKDGGGLGFNINGIYYQTADGLVRTHGRNGYEKYFDNKDCRLKF